MKRIGAISVGQAPRLKVNKDISPILGDDVEIIEAGVWDGVPLETIEKYKPVGDEDRVLAFLQDGTEIVYAERYGIPRIQECIYRLQDQGASLILMYCNCMFPAMDSRVPLIYPRDCMDGFIKAFAKNMKVAVLTPTEEFVPQWTATWKRLTDNATILTANISGDNIMKEIEIAAEGITAQNFDLVSLDCMGYTVETQEHFRRLTGKPVVLSRTLMARMAAEYLR